MQAGSYLRLIDSCIRLKDLLGPVTRVKKKKKYVPARKGVALFVQGKALFIDLISQNVLIKWFL